MQTKHVSFIFICAALSVLLLSLTACHLAEDTPEPGKVSVMATTSVVGDVVQQIGGEYVQVELLLPLGTDPHSFTPTPQDITRLAAARLVFINGAGLEEFLAPMIESADVGLRIVDLSAGITLRTVDASDHPEGETEDHAGDDPHTWLDPNNVILWSGVVAEALSAQDPQHAAIYQANAQIYIQELSELDRWVVTQVELIPPENRQLVTDHQVFGYFADRYGFEQVGAIIPGFSTLSEPSAQELAALEDSIQQLNVPALFVGFSVNQNLAQRMAEDTGIQIVPLYTHSLTPPGGEVDEYTELIRYDVNAIVSALK